MSPRSKWRRTAPWGTKASEFGQWPGSHRMRPGKLHTAPIVADRQPSIKGGQPRIDARDVFENTRLLANGQSAKS